MRRWSWLLISFAGLAQSAPPPPRIEVAYELSRDGSVVADVVETLQHGDGLYEITETSKGRGLFSLFGGMKRVSRGVIDAKGVRPLEYLDERPGWTDARASFDWKARVITMLHKKEERTVPMPPDAQDQLSFVLAFSLFPPKASATAVTYSVADSRGLAQWLYQIEGRERIKTPAGEFNTIKLVRTKDNQRAELWLADEIGKFPVQARVLYKDGSRLEQVAVRVSAPPPQ
jgi:hypothetical protein